MRRCRGPKGPRTAPERHLELNALSCIAGITRLPVHLSLLKFKELKPKAVLLLAMLLVLVPMQVMLVLVLPAVLTTMTLT